MKNKLIIILTVALIFSIMFSGCSQNSENQSTDNSTIKKSIVVTTFPTYDWINKILGDNSSDFEVLLLTDSGIDMHNYQPSTADIATILNSDLFIYNGGDSDAWAEDVVAQMNTSDAVTINIMQKIANSLKEEEFVEGMEHDHEEHEYEDHEHEEHEDHDHEDHDHEEHEHEDEDHDHEDHDHEGVYDEHVWLSLKNAMQICGELSLAVQSLDPENSTTYIANTENYINQLKTLEEKFETELLDTNKDTLIFADRFPFRYLVDDYDISYYAAFSGCSAETEASFETVVFLTDKLNELQLEELIIIDGENDSIAKTVIQNSSLKNTKILTLNSLQAISTQEINEGATYLTLMEQNLQILIEALN